MGDYTVYYLLCGLGWLIPIGFAYGLFRAAKAMRGHAPVERRGIIVLIGIGAAVVLLNCYLVTYPFAVIYPSTDYRDLFVPADWAYDHTPLRHPIRLFGKYLGADGQLEQQRQARAVSGVWRAQPELQAAGILVVGSVLVASALWLAKYLRRESRFAKTVDN